MQSRPAEEVKDFLLAGEEEETLAEQAAEFCEERRGAYAEFWLGGGRCDRKGKKRKADAGTAVEAGLDR